MAKMSTESWCTAWGSIYWVQEDIQRDQHNDGRIQKSIVTAVTGAEHEQMRGIGSETETTCSISLTENRENTVTYVSPTVFTG